MQTYCFIGSDKNAGKTTAFNFIYEKMHKEQERPEVCVTGTGINGEATDNFDGRAKPTIRLQAGSLFLTHSRHLSRHTGKYSTLQTFAEPSFRGHYVLGRCLVGFPVVLEGPNTGSEFVVIKEALAKKLMPDGTLLIDGSIDRQFLADPTISDMFYFSLLFSGRAPQLLGALRLPTGPEHIAGIVQRLKTAATKSLLFGGDGRLHYRGEQTPFSDGQLQRACESLGKEPAWLYLNGAFSRSLADFLAPYGNIDLLLDNFTLCLSRADSPAGRKLFRPRLSLLHPARIKAVFVKQEAPFDPGLLPEKVPVINLFRQGAWS
ncbi:MAG: hypothetical protein VR65_02915 [Desulfobulbaceae bacterium BRH_c16a]|nr:MAG: hypothetical protein VR65_02915 [Desulfobulbaceae bacterium BRH_c16a]